MICNIHSVQAVFRLLKNRMYYCFQNSQGIFFTVLAWPPNHESVPKITEASSSLERMLIVSLQELLHFL